MTAQTGLGPSYQRSTDLWALNWASPQYATSKIFTLIMTSFNFHLVHTHTTHRESWHSKWHPIPYLLHYFWPVPTKVVHCISWEQGAIWYTARECHQIRGGWIEYFGVTGVSVAGDLHPEVRTVHLESIQTPWLFPHFITLQPYSKKKFPSSIYTQYPIMTKQKLFFEKCANVLTIKTENNIYLIIQTLYSVLCWSTFGSDYSYKSSWE